MTLDGAGQMQARLRADLQLAMRARRRGEMSVLRSLIAAIDNAQAVPVGDLHEKYVVHDFGDKSVEVSRRDLTAEDLRALLQNEVDARRAASTDYRRIGRLDRAEILSDEADIISRYLDATDDP